jgi:hypothetical protein
VSPASLPPPSPSRDPRGPCCRGDGRGDYLDLREPFDARDAVTGQGGFPEIPDVPEKPDGVGRAWLIQRLVKEAAVTETEASDLVMLLGVNWSSLVREARLLKKR